MASHNEFGKEAELLAEKWLLEKGYEILFRNWRHSHYEIDIVALKNNVLHVIEVKARRSDYFGNPEESVTRKKFKSLQKAADEFLFLHPEYHFLQYDILAITCLKNKVPEFFLIEDFYC
ncbi:MAG: YraN family protein [Bacteroidetes bacterium]|nr:YraN family protein [Bacteroidota bacterium]MBS1631857.1 YraN family protein [Bacteroidota bacterium]